MGASGLSFFGSMFLALPIADQSGCGGSALSHLSIPKGALEPCLDFRIGVLHWVCQPRDL